MNPEVEARCVSSVIPTDLQALTRADAMRFAAESEAMLWQRHGRLSRAAAAQEWLSEANIDISALQHQIEEVTKRAYEPSVTVRTSVDDVRRFVTNRITAETITAAMSRSQHGADVRKVIPTIVCVDVCGVTVPASDHDLIHAMQESQSILALDDDWDGEGSPRVSQDTWFAALSLLGTIAMRARQRLGLQLLVPRIDPGPNGSIDLHWCLPDRELLINIPADLDRAPSYYGDDIVRTATIEGTLSRFESNSWIAAWLLNR